MRVLVVPFMLAALLTTSLHAQRYTFLGMKEGMTHQDVHNIMVANHYDSTVVIALLSEWHGVLPGYGYKVRITSNYVHDSTSIAPTLSQIILQVTTASPSGLDIVPILRSMLVEKYGPPTYQNTDPFDFMIWGTSCLSTHNECILLYGADNTGNIVYFWRSTSSGIRRIFHELLTLSERKTNPF